MSDQEMIKKALETFREECAELLVEIEGSVMDMSEEEQAQNAQLINRAFRGLHTIKGSAGMFKLDSLVQFAHEVESIYDLLRSGRMEVTEGLKRASLASVDHLRALLEAALSGAPSKALQAEGGGILARLRALAPEHTPAPLAKAQPSGGCPEEGPLWHTFRIRFAPPRDVFLRGLNPVHALEDLRKLGKCFTLAHHYDVPPLEMMDAEHCYMKWDIILNTTRCKEEVDEALGLLLQCSEVRVDLLEDANRATEDEEYKRLGEILLERGDVEPEELQKILAERGRIGEALVKSRAAKCEDVAAALAEQQALRALRTERKEAQAQGSVRVASERLDKLVNLVGEIASLQAHLTQKAEDNMLGDNPLHPEDLFSLCGEMETLISDLHASAMGIRMVPLSSIFSKLRRHAHDLSATLGRQVAFEALDGETELDKSVIERLGDPLMHIIRNSIDHGIETPETRASAGKPIKGTIRLSAEHVGSHVLIHIEDDGKGIDAEAVYKKALDLGLLSASEARPMEDRLFQFIFAPGFSTAAKVTDVSGRGVGMDVVKRTIEALQGTVSLDSRPGQGTRLTLQLPLTLAIIDGLLVRVGDIHYIFPMSSVMECLEADTDKRNMHIVDLRGEPVPVIGLREMLGHTGQPPEGQMVVIATLGRQKAGYAVDMVVGKQQNVVKPLGRVYKDAKCVSGATVMGNGRVALILDINKLFEEALRREDARTRAQ